MAKPAPTAEQQQIVDAFLTGGSLVIEAGAGTGKTTTLRMLGEAVPQKRGTYIAYNTALAKDAAGSFPSNVECRTAHSYAWHAVVKPSAGFKRRLNGPKMKTGQQARIMGIRGNFPISDELSFSASQQAVIANGTVQRFCNSADDEITARHVPSIDGVEGDARTKLQQQITPIAKRAWADVTDERGQLPFKHDHYLKIWALRKPIMRTDFLLFDEAQDANPVIAGVVGHQSAQKVMVGDAAQAIYGWRGAVDAMSEFEADHRLYLTQSFRFGPAVAAEANKWLDIINANLRLVGFDQVESRVQNSALTPGIVPDAILCRTNAEAISQAMALQAQGLTVAIVGDTAEKIGTLAKVAEALMRNEQPWQAEYAAFDNWHDFKQHAEDEGDSNLLVFIRLVDNYGVEPIIKVAKQSVKETQPHDVVVSTAHKAKGREWNVVRIATDFKEPNRDNGETIRKDEAMLAYVAVTRAKIVLDNIGLAWVDSWAKTAVAV